MCIVIVKPAGAKLPKRSVLEIAHGNNPDGAGFMYSRGGQVHIQKGWFTFEGFYNALCGARLGKGETAVLHFRIATHGATDRGNCHPFPIVGTFQEMRRETWSGDYGLAHNGILESPMHDKNASDTMHLVKMLDATRLHVKAAGNEQWAAVLEMAVRGSKVAILRADGTARRYGDGWEETGKCFYSNDGYKASTFWNIREWRAQRAEYLGYTLVPDSPDVESETEYKRRELRAAGDGDMVADGICPDCGQLLTAADYCPDCHVIWEEPALTFPDRVDPDRDMPEDGSQDAPDGQCGLYGLLDRWPEDRRIGY